jgi:beta-1,4-mannosyl-glycoprotein beta-1,4-N-acetylglucosaminyltransferase
MIIDCTIYNDEIDLLMFRLKYLDASVDKFLIAEASHTFQGKEKSTSLTDHSDILKPFIEKIIYLPIRFPFTKIEMQSALSQDRFALENIQRDCLKTFLISQNFNGIYFFSDIDEIWNSEALNPYLRSIDRREPYSAKLSLNFYYFFFNLKGIGLSNSLWERSFFMTHASLVDNKFASLNALRTAKFNTKIENAGWHFSYLGGVESIVRKLESFSHSEVNNDYFKSKSRLDRCLRIGLDPFDRIDHEWAFVHLQTFPSKIEKLMLEYPEFIKWSLTEQ